MSVSVARPRMSVSVARPGMSVSVARPGMSVSIPGSDSPPRRGRVPARKALCPAASERRGRADRQASWQRRRTRPFSTGMRGRPPPFWPGDGFAGRRRWSRCVGSPARVGSETAGSPNIRGQIRRTACGAVRTCCHQPVLILINHTENNFMVVSFTCVRERWVGQRTSSIGRPACQPDRLGASTHEAGDPDRPGGGSPGPIDILCVDDALDLLESTARRRPF